MTQAQLETRYGNIPQELKSLKRWVGYKVETLAEGKTTKRPYNPLTGSMARVNDELTWSTFKLALLGCEKYNFDGIGFVLGEGIFGVDLDNHVEDGAQSEEEYQKFKDIANEFVATLNSYTEWSQSGKGIHIICKGTLPEGSRRKGCVEMYDANRFFAFTGKAIRNIPPQDREKEIKPLWEKYVFTPAPVIQTPAYSRPNTELYETIKLSDQEVLDNVANSRQSEVFFRYYDNGDISLQGGDASKADMAFCSMLAFWCNKDIAQMDRIFRNSGLMRPKWDEHRGPKTYGQLTLDVACKNVGETFVKTRIADKVKIGKKAVVVETVDKKAENGSENDSEIEYVPSLDEYGEPIFRIKKVYGSYPYSDTGNALKFYDYFGDLFKYNVTDKVFMFWTGKTWIKDTTNVIRKYANKLIDIMKEDDEAIAEQIEQLSAAGRVDESKRMEKILDASRKNTARVANKAGKDAMLSEFQTLKDIPVENSVFNKNDYLLNTESGIVDLRTGLITAWDRTKLLSKNTHSKVSFERSEVWEKFLWSVFDNGNLVETQEIIDSLQTCVGYSLTGSTEEQCMFLLFGDGSNGKSTLVETIASVIGDYATSMDSKLLVSQKGQANSPAEYAIATLQKVRFVTTGETDEGGRLAEAQVKVMTGSDPVNARFPFGNPFKYYPNFKIWMSTNHLPNIRGNDYGIWRRVFLFTFNNTFTAEQKDKSLPSKLRMDADKILGWCIKGFLMYQEHKGLIVSQQTIDDTAKFKKQTDQILQFIDEKCILDKRSSIECTELYDAYKVWAANNTDFIKKESQFSTELTAKDGITRNRNGVKAWCYYGIRLNGVNIIGKSQQ